MKYFKKEQFGKEIAVISIGEEDAITVWEDGEINFHTSGCFDSDWHLQNGYVECSREDFTTFFITKKQRLDNLIKEL